MTKYKYTRKDLITILQLRIAEEKRVLSMYNEGEENEETKQAAECLKIYTNLLNIITDTINTRYEDLKKKRFFKTLTAEEENELQKIEGEKKENEKNYNYKNN